MPAHPTATLPEVTRSETALHVGLISAVVTRHEALTTGFRRSLARWIQSVDPTYGPDGDDEIWVPRRRPDCYRLADGTLTVWEAEATCPLTGERLGDWATLWWELDASDLPLALDLRVVDKTGAEHLVDLCAARYDDVTGKLASWVRYSRPASPVSRG